MMTKIEEQTHGIQLTDAELLAAGQELAEAEDGLTAHKEHARGLRGVLRSEQLAMEERVRALAGTVRTRRARRAVEVEVAYYAMSREVVVTRLEGRQELVRRDMTAAEYERCAQGELPLDAPPPSAQGDPMIPDGEAVPAEEPLPEPGTEFAQPTPWVPVAGGHYRSPAGEVRSVSEVFQPTDPERQDEITYRSVVPAVAADATVTRPEWDEWAGGVACVRLSEIEVEACRPKRSKRGTKPKADA
jgi:hypothetical protein